MNRLSIPAVLLLLSSSAHAAEPSAKEPACVALDASLSGAAAVSFDKLSGPAGFERFRSAAATAAKAGDKALAARLDSLVRKPPCPPPTRGLAACLLRGYVVARYGDADGPRPPGDGRLPDLRRRREGRTGTLPEFVRQREWLAAAGRERRVPLQVLRRPGGRDHPARAGAHPRRAHPRRRPGGGEPARGPRRPSRRRSWTARSSAAAPRTTRGRSWPPSTPWRPCATPAGRSLHAPPPGRQRRGVELGRDPVLPGARAHAGRAPSASTPPIRSPTPRRATAC